MDQKTGDNSIRLEWSDYGKRSFEMIRLPYFEEHMCSVFNCQGRAKYQCHYSLKTDNRGLMVEFANSSVSFCLCKHHEKQKFLEHDYDKDRVDKYDPHEHMYD